MAVRRSRHKAFAALGAADQQALEGALLVSLERYQRDGDSLIVLGEYLEAVTWRA